MKTVLHFQSKLQTRLCCPGRSEQVTLNPSEVTCKNCLSKLKLTVRQKFNKTVDWGAVYDSVSKLVPGIQRAALEFAFANPWCKFTCEIENYPPKICLVFWLPATTDKRRKTVGIFDPLAPNRIDSNVVQVHVPDERQVDLIATFVGEQAETHGLRPWRIRGDSASLDYELKPKYGSDT